MKLQFSFHVVLVSIAGTTRRVVFTLGFLFEYFYLKEHAPDDPSTAHFPSAIDLASDRRDRVRQKRLLASRGKQNNYLVFLKFGNFVGFTYFIYTGTCKNKKGRSKVSISTRNNGIDSVGYEDLQVVLFNGLKDIGGVSYFFFKKIFE